MKIIMILLIAASAFLLGAADVFKVTPRTKYRLSFEADRQGGETFASDPDGDFNIFRYRGKRYPVMRLQFKDAAGKTVPHDNCFFAVAPDKPSKYDFIFYTPSGAATCEPVFAIPKDTELKITGLNLAEEKDEKAINVNPDFSAGPYNYSGITGANDNTIRVVTDENGKNYFFTGFYAWTTRFPLTPGKKYMLTMKGTGNYKNRVDSSLFFWSDSDWKKPISEVAMPRLTTANKGEITYEFTAPENGYWASLRIYRATIAEIKVTEVVLNFKISP